MILILGFEMLFIGTILNISVEGKIKKKWQSFFETSPCFKTDQEIFTILVLIMQVFFPKACWGRPNQRT